jgi:hypothetical protein
MARTTKSASVFLMWSSILILSSCRSVPKSGAKSVEEYLASVSIVPPDSEDEVSVAPVGIRADLNCLWVDVVAEGSSEQSSELGLVFFILQHARTETFDVRKPNGDRVRLDNLERRWGCGGPTSTEYSITLANGRRRVLIPCVSRIGLFESVGGGRYKVRIAPAAMDDKSTLPECHIDDSWHEFDIVQAPIQPVGVMQAFAGRRQ